MRFQEISVLVFALIAGLMTGIVIKAVSGASRTGIPVSSLLLGQTSDEIVLLKSEVASLREENSRLLKDMLSGEVDREKVRQELIAARGMAGLLPVEGPGVEITISDVPQEDQSEFSFSDEGIVHDYDLLYLLNELRAAGAEAISIGSGSLEERIVGTSFIRCTGPTVVVNNQKLTAPFVIKAIGDPLILYNSLTMPRGIIEQLRRYKLPIEIKKVERMRVAGYSLPVVFKLGQFVETETRNGEGLKSDSTEDNKPSSRRRKNDNDSEAVEVGVGR